MKFDARSDHGGYLMEKNSLLSAVQGSLFVLFFFFFGVGSMEDLSCPPAIPLTINHSAKLTACFCDITSDTIPADTFSFLMLTH